MKKLLVTPLAILLLAACAATTPSASGSPGATASGVAAATASASASAGAAAKYVKLQVVVPESNARAGVDGVGWTVDVIAKGNGPALDRVKPAFMQGGGTGRHQSFPGLIVLLRPVSGGQTASANVNLARMFQIVGLPNTLGATAGLSSVDTTASPVASASPAGTAARAATDNSTAQATWFVQQNTWGSDIDVELTVFVVEGDAPDVVADRTALRIVSDEITVRFHINAASAPGSARPSGSASPTASGSPSSRPSASASSSP
jgi:hypothetical protein